MKGKRFWLTALAAAGLALLPPREAQAELPWIGYWFPVSKASGPESKPVQVKFRVGCYSITRLEWLDCEMDLKLFYDTSEVPSNKLLFWTGSHWEQSGHGARTAGDTVRTIGKLWSELEPNAQDKLHVHGFTRNQALASELTIPEVAGVVQLRSWCKFPRDHRCLTSPWLDHDDPDDPHACYRLEAIGATAPEPLVELPDTLPGMPTPYVRFSVAPQHRPPGRENDHSDPTPFYGLPDMIGRLILLGMAYQELTGCKVSFNDLSLPFGGLYDINNNWSPPHKLHRVGRSVDVNHKPDSCSAQLVDEDILDKQAKGLGLTRYEREQGRIHYEYKEKAKGGQP
jgi:hypothetical protein